MIKFATEHARLIAVLLVVATLAFGALIPRVHIDTDPENMLSKDDPARVFHNRMKKQFNVHDMIVLGVVNEEDPDGVFNPGSLKKIYELTEFAKRLRGKGLEEGAIPVQVAASKGKGAGAQYYVEHMMHYGAYRKNLPAGMPRADKNNHRITLRITKLLLHQDMRLSLFSFFGLAHRDMYLRPYASYKITDRLRIDGGANIFVGKHRNTMFGQLTDDTNAYVGLRYSF